MSTETQCAQILKYMRSHGSITRLRAIKVAGSVNLPGRIYDLKKRGHLINDAWISRNGKRFKAYSLVEGKRRAA